MNKTLPVNFSDIHTGLETNGRFAGGVVLSLWPQVSKCFLSELLTLQHVILYKVLSLASLNPFALLFSPYPSVSVNLLCEFPSNLSFHNHLLSLSAL